MRIAVSALLTMVVALIAYPATAQEISLSLESEQIGCCSAEIFMTTDSSVDVFINGDLDREVSPLDDVCSQSTSEFNWVANTEGDPDDVTCEPYAVLPQGYFHRMTFGSVELGFFACVNSPDSFYCPFGDGSSDSILDVESGFDVHVSSEDNNDWTFVDYESVFVSGAWLLPHHGPEYCMRYLMTQEDIDDCIDAVPNLGYFYSNNVDSTFDLTDADMLVPDGADWRFNDVVLNFHDDTGVVVAGSLRVDVTAELNFEEDTDPFAAGITIPDGGHVDIDGASITGGDLRMETSTTSELTFRVVDGGRWAEGSTIRLT